MTQPHDVAAIAAGLSQAQREMLLTARTTIGGDVAVFHHGRRERTFTVFVELGLARRRIGIADCLTTLGLAVRAHLQQVAG